MLSNHPICHSTDIGEFEDLLQYYAGGRSFDVAGDKAQFNFRVNMAPASKVTVLWSTCNLPTRASYSPVTYFRHVFPFRKSMQVSLEGDEFRLCSHRLGHLIPGNINWQMKNVADVESLTLWIQLDTLRNNLEAMIGEAVDKDLRFMPVENNDPYRALNLRSALFEYARELEARDRRLSPVAMAELEQGLVLRFLLYNRSNYSHFLESAPLDARKEQMRRVEEYLVANWDRPLDIAELAIIAGVSARSVFRTFQKIYGISPQGFVKRVRLENARNFLLSSEDEASVKDVAVKCGFQALGHFAAAYRELFGELPSETTRRK